MGPKESNQTNKVILLNGKLLWQYWSDFMPMAKLYNSAKCCLQYLADMHAYGPNEGKVLAC